MKTCSVCFQNTKNIVLCPFCSENKNIFTCRECTEEYLLSSFEEPHCMACKNKWGHKIMNDSFTTSFLIGKYRKSRQKVLLDREKSLLPATMPLIEDEKRKRKIKCDIEKLKKKKAELNAQIRKLKQKVLVYNNEINVHMHNLNNTVVSKKIVYVCPCPEEECKGYIEKEKYKCGLCEIRICRRCHHCFESKDLKELKKEKADHECDDNNKKSVKAIMKETKPCPKCAERIFKIEGCDQMFCTSCQTPFSWNSGEIVKGVIHNPHYYEMMRNMGNIERNIGDIPCGGLPDFRDVDAVLKKIYGDIFIEHDHQRFPLKDVYQAIMLLHRRVGECQAYIDGQRVRIRRQGDIFEKIRVDYILGTIRDDKEFKSCIFRAERVKEKKDEELQILDTFVTGIRELFINFCKDSPKVEEMSKKFVQDSIKIVSFCNKAFRDNYTAMNYKSFPQINLVKSLLRTSLPTYRSLLIVGKEI